MAGSLEKVLRDTSLSLKVLRLLSETSYDSILITDATKGAKIVYANRAFKKLTGYAPAEVIGKTPRILQGAGTGKKVIARLAKALKNGGKFEGQAINYRKDGTPFIMVWRVLPVKAGKQTRFWVAIQREGFAIQ
jgi:PAS domain S-box-containing protein